MAKAQLIYSKIRKASILSKSTSINETDSITSKILPKDIAKNLQRLNASIDGILAWHTRDSAGYRLVLPPATERIPIIKEAFNEYLVRGYENVITEIENRWDAEIVPNYEKFFDKYPDAARGQLTKSSIRARFTPKLDFIFDSGSDLREMILSKEYCAELDKEKEEAAKKAVSEATEEHMQNAIKTLQKIIEQTGDDNGKAPRKASLPTINTLYKHFEELKTLLPHTDVEDKLSDSIAEFEIIIQDISNKRDECDQKDSNLAVGLADLKAAAEKGKNSISTTLETFNLSISMLDNVEDEEEEEVPVVEVVPDIDFGSFASIDTDNEEEEEGNVSIVNLLSNL